MEIMPQRVFKKSELLQYDGENLPMYIAYKGFVYDVSACPKWRNGLHEGLHFPGQDLTTELIDAPHADEVFTRPCVKIIGRLQSE